MGDAMTLWTLGWIGWLVWFFIEELAAIYFGGWEATLSGHVWLAFAIKDSAGDLQGRGHFWRLRRIALIALMGWLTLHFLSGGHF